MPFCLHGEQPQAGREQKGEIKASGEKSERRGTLQGSASLSLCQLKAGLNYHQFPHLGTGGNQFFNLS